MAQKRMFDKSIIENDRFMDLSMGAKALYFLLGMEADDEGFVSPKRVMRIYGGNEDDLNVLVLKNFVIRFESGVVVITDRKENNYLDKNRIKETKYILEKSMIKSNGTKYQLTSQVKHTLNNCSTSIEEKRGEESTITQQVAGDFEMFWNLYDKKIDKDKAYKKFMKLSEIERAAIFEQIPKYKLQQTDKRFRKDPCTYLNNKSRQNEIVIGGIDYTILENFHDMMMKDKIQELKKVLGTEEYFRIKAQRKQSPLYLSF